MIDIPVIETERLRLRAPAERDLDAWIAFNRTERTRFVGGPQSPNAIWRGLATYLGHWALRGYGMWAVDLKADDTLCGMVGPWCPGGWPEPEIGWTLLASAEGRGIAREAAEASRAWVYGTLDWTTAISLIDPENTRSITLAERMGARHDGDFTHDEFGFMRIYRHPGPEAIDPAGRLIEGAA
ncbi:MAG: GNAT family N-acetyltransferase [Pseudomonadota bacterium]